MSAVVLALVGTDHHHFDRFIDWIDEEALRHPETRFLVQHGDTRAPLVAEGRPYYPHHELLEAFDAATVVLCHGGPATIMDARSRGHVPICVPRDPARGEHVDGHQMAFAAAAARSGLVRLASTRDELTEELEAALEGRDIAELPNGVSIELDIDAARRRAGDELDALIQSRPRRRELLRRLVARH